MSSSGSLSDNSVLELEDKDHKITLKDAKASTGRADT